MNLAISIRRTLVPAIAGALMASAAGPYLDEVLVTEALVAVSTAIYYAVFRVLEEQGFTWATMLLGGATPPNYEVDTGVVAEVDESEQSDED